MSEDKKTYNCLFCKEADDFAFCKTFLGNRWPFDSRVIYDDRQIFSVVAVGPQVTPYVLIIPKRHIYSGSEMNLSESISFVKCLNFLQNKGGFSDRLCLFEHGGRSDLGSSSIDHCHIHVIDGNFDLFNYICDSHFLRINNFKYPKLLKKEEYLLIGEYSNNILNIKVSYKQFVGEHQYFRKELANMIDSNYWNWREDMKIDNMVKTMLFFQQQKSEG